jgi:hypothetical protein
MTAETSVKTPPAAIYDVGAKPAKISAENAWPPEGLDWSTLWLDAASGRLLDAPAEQAASASFAIRRGAPAFLWTFAEEADIVGPMALRIGTSMSTCLPLGSRCIRICTPTSPPWRDPSGRPCAEFPCDTIPERRRSASRDARAVALSQEPLLGNFPIRLQAEPERNMRRPHGRFL